MVREAMLYEKKDDGRVVCRLCAHGCAIAPGKGGSAPSGRTGKGCFTP